MGYTELWSIIPELVKVGLFAKGVDLRACFALLLLGIGMFISLGVVVHLAMGSEIHIKLWKFEFKIKENKKR